MKNQWTITAKLASTGRKIDWTYDRATDASRAWKCLSEKWQTIDTADAVSAASIKRPDGSVSTATKATL